MEYGLLVRMEVLACGAALGCPDIAGRVLALRPLRAVMAACEEAGLSEETAAGLLMGVVLGKRALERWQA